MKILSKKRCNLGEGPIWNEKEQKLYYTNGYGANELCIYDIKTDKLDIRKLPTGVAAYAFDIENRLIISHAGGVHILNDDDTLTPIYDNEIYKIEFANDMKVGPDGAIYVGTQSRKRKKLSDDIDGKLYRISPEGKVRVLLDGLLLSNGMEWSLDETRFYHTDSDTATIKEYFFDKKLGRIEFTGREVCVPGVDGFTIGDDNRLYVGCWGRGHVAVVDITDIQVIQEIKIPAKIPSSCGFCGENMDILAITTVSNSHFTDVKADENAGYTILMKTNTSGRKPYLFGESKK